MIPKIGIKMRIDKVMILLYGNFKIFYVKKYLVLFFSIVINVISNKLSKTTLKY